MQEDLLWINWHCKELTQLTEWKRTCKWSPETDTDFRFLIESVYRVPVLNYSLPCQKLLNTDASNVSIGGVMWQKEGSHK